MHVPLQKLLTVESVLQRMPEMQPVMPLALQILEAPLTKDLRNGNKNLHRYRRLLDRA